MIRPLRDLHRTAWWLLAILLPLVYILALLDRPPVLQRTCLPLATGTRTTTPPQESVR